MLPFSFLLIVIAPILLEAAIRGMSRCTHNLMQRNPTKQIDGYESSSSRMAAYQFVLWDAFRVTDVLRMLIKALDVEMVDTAYIIGCECYLLVLAVGKLDKVIGRGNDCPMSGCPCKGRFKL